MGWPLIQNLLVSGRTGCTGTLDLTSLGNKHLQSKHFHLKWKRRHKCLHLQVSPNHPISCPLPSPAGPCDHEGTREGKGRIPRRVVSPEGLNSHEGGSMALACIPLCLCRLGLLQQQSQLWTRTIVKCVLENEITRKELATIITLAVLTFEKGKNTRWFPPLVFLNSEAEGLKQNNKEKELHLAPQITEHQNRKGPSG